MPKVIKKILLSLSLTFALAIIVLAVVLIQPQLLRGLIHSGAQRYAGLDVELSDFRSHINPLRFEISGLQIANPEWPRPELLTLANIRIAMTENPFGKEPFWTLSAENLNINVAKNDSGAFNWISSKLPASTEPEVVEEVSSDESILPGDFNFKRIDIKAVTLIWRDQHDKESRVYLPEISGERIDAGNGDFHIGLDYLKQHFELNSTIHIFDPKAGILKYSLAIKHRDLDLNSEGKLILSPNLDGSTLSLKVDLRSADALAKLSGSELPTLPNIRLSTAIAIKPDYEFGDIILKLNNSEVRGKVTVDAKTSAVKAKLSSANLDIDSLLPPSSADVDTGKAANTPTTVSTQTEEAEMDWAWLDTTKVALDLDIKKLNAAGWQVTNLKTQAKLSSPLTLKLSAGKITEIATQRALNDVVAKLELTPLAKSTQGADAEIQLILAQQSMSASASGKLNLNGSAGTSLQIKANTENSKALWTLAQQPWQEAGAIALAADFKAEASSYTIKGKAAMAKQNIDFNLNFKPASAELAIAELDGNLALRRIDLAFISSPKPVNALTDSPKSKAKKTKIISDETLDLSALKSINANIKLELEDINTGYNLIRTATLSPTLKDGVFKLKNTTVNFDGGEMKLALKFNSAEALPSLDLRLSIDGDDYGKLGLEPAAGIIKGHGRIRIDANTKGASPHQLAANMDAKLDAKISDLIAQGNALNLIGSDLLSETIDKLNPFSEKKTSTDIECIAIHFKGKNGKLISDDGIALETRQTKIIGTGHLDLGKEQLLFGVSPIARTGVGINVGAAAGLVRLGGTFSKPKIVADPAGMFTSGLSTGAAIYTGGLSLLAQGLLKRAIYAGSACDGDIDSIPTAKELPDKLLKPALPPEEMLPARQTPTATSPGA